MQTAYGTAPAASVNGEIRTGITLPHVLGLSA